MQGTFGGMSPAEAGRKSAEARRKKREEAAKTAATRTPLDALRDLMAADPEAYAAGLAKLVRDGDPRAITIMRDLFRVNESVTVPRTERAIRAMSAEERRALLITLEAKGVDVVGEDSPEAAGAGTGEGEG